ncbi:hypothetical protein J4218_04835 [Candidatus Pacearchaeota archaeon]|nr:hypothetical protein [Candidatus Pacearchaeota archaeon]
MDEEEPAASEHDSSQTGVDLLDSIVFPANKDILKWIFEVGVHCSDFEKLAILLNVGASEDQQPHDMSDGEFSKLSPGVVRYLPFQYVRPKLDYEQFIAPGIRRHRKSLHHVLGNGDEINPVATKEDHIRTAIDSFSAIRGKRVYVDPAPDYASILRIFLKGAPPDFKSPPQYKIDYFQDLLEKLKGMNVPDISVFERRKFIKQRGYLPNAFGLPDKLHDQIVGGTRKAFEMVRSGEYRAIWEKEEVVAV